MKGIKCILFGKEATNSTKDCTDLELLCVNHYSFTVEHQ